MVSFLNIYFAISGVHKYMKLQCMRHLLVGQGYITYVFKIPNYSLFSICMQFYGTEFSVVNLQETLVELANASETEMDIPGNFD